MGSRKVSKSFLFCKVWVFSFLFQEYLDSDMDGINDADDDDDDNDGIDDDGTVQTC